MPERYPGYDVLNKRDTQSWNDATRAVLDARLAIVDAPRFLDPDAWRTLRAVCDRLVPQPPGRESVPLAALVDRKLAGDERDGYRNARLPPLREAWRLGLAAIDAEAMSRYSRSFHLLPSARQDELLTAMQDGELVGAAWEGMPADLFFSERVAHDVFAAYYSHPASWNEIGFGGPASPRGYVRMYFNRRDPWEAVESKPGTRDKTRKLNEHVR